MCKCNECIYVACVNVPSELVRREKKIKRKFLLVRSEKQCDSTKRDEIMSELSNRAVR